MSDDLSNDGSVEAAVADMPDIEALEIENGRTFEDAKPEARAPKPDPVVKVVEKAEPAKTAEPDADVEDDDYIEFPSEEEGKEASRVKLAEVIEKYRSAEKLTQELAAAKAAPRWSPPEVDQHIAAAVTAQQQHLNEMRQWQKFNQPDQPDQSLLDPRNPNRNPDLYFAQTQRYQSLLQAHQQINAQAAQIETDTRQQQEALHGSKLMREQAELLKFWPEAGDEKVAQKVYSDLKSHYGLDENTVKSVVDHRFYKLAKDALAFREAQAKQQEAVKVVKAKPKLVSGNARSSTSAPARRSNEAFGRLQQSGSIEDAADALDGLL